MPKKKSEKHAQKNFTTTAPAVAVEGSLPLDLPVKSASFTLSAHAHAEELFPITNLTDAQLRQIALQKNPATGAAWIPKPARSLWPTVATLAGLLEWREAKGRRDNAPRLDTISFPSMEACEGATGITKTLQQLAKNSGCTAFRGPRVYLHDLVRWIFTEAAAGKTADWGKINIELDAKLKQVKLDTELRRLIELDEAGQVLQNFASIMFNGIKRLKMEAPRDFEMRDRAYIKALIEEKIQTLFDQAKTELTKLIGQAEQTENEKAEK